MAEAGAFPDALPLYFGVQAGSSATTSAHCCLPLANFRKRLRHRRPAAEPFGQRARIVFCRSPEHVAREYARVFSHDSPPIFQERAIVYPRIERAGVQTRASDRLRPAPEPLQHEVFRDSRSRNKFGLRWCAAKLLGNRGDGLEDLLFVGHGSRVTFDGWVMICAGAGNGRALAGGQRSNREKTKRRQDAGVIKRKSPDQSRGVVLYVDKSTEGHWLCQDELSFLRKLFIFNGRSTHHKLIL